MKSLSRFVWALVVLGVIAALWLPSGRSGREEAPTDGGPVAAAADPRRAPAGGGAAADGAGDTSPRQAPRSGDPVAAERHRAALTGGPAAIVAFEDWAERYAAADAAGRAAMLVEGRELVEARREEFLAVIRNDPRLALDLALPWRLRRDLPAEFVSRLEERVSAKGDLLVKAALPSTDVAPSSEFRSIAREAAIGERRFEAHVFGARVAQPTRLRVSLHGVAIDRHLAVAEGPLRVLEAGEPPSSEKEPTDLRCPVSKKEAGYDQEPADREPDVVVESGDKIYYLCSGGHIAALNEELLVLEQGSTGGGHRLTDGAPMSITGPGPKRLLYIRVIYPDDLSVPQSEADAYATIEGVNAYLLGNSYGSTYLIPTVPPVVMMPRTRAYYEVNDTGGIPLEDARAAVRAIGYDPDQYELDAVRYNGPGNFGGQAYVGFKGCWLKDGSVRVVLHELGHNLGLMHANYWKQYTLDPVGPGENEEYGNPYSAMSTNYSSVGQFTVHEKSVLRWLPAGAIQDVARNGVYRLSAYDLGVRDPALTYALRFPKDSNRTYWLESRQLFNRDSIRNGVMVLWGPWSGTSGGQLIDTTAGTPAGKDDASVVVGRTFSDPAAALHITPLRRNATTPPSIDVAVNRGPFPGNRPPSLAVTASARSVGVNVPVTFTATAADPDGDELAYHWEFGDGGVGMTNTPVFTKAFATAAHQTVRCTVSDLRGGATSRLITVTVGTPTTFLLEGRVLTPDGLPVPEVLVTNGRSGSAYRGVRTDSDGRYALGNLAADSYTLGASGVAMNIAPPSFANPVTVGPGRSGLDFTATPFPTVSVARLGTGPLLETGGAPDTLIVSRTGSTTSALAVRLAVEGTYGTNGAAVLNQDFTLTPALTSVANETTGYSYPVGTVTIPAGASSVSLTLSAVNDTVVEGDEPLFFAVREGAGYVVAEGDGARVRTALIDDESTVPTLWFEPSFATLGEGSGLLLTLRRSRVTAAPLEVEMDIYGNATADSDYDALPSRWTIPAGEASVAFQVNTRTDARVENMEYFQVQPKTSDAYARSLVHGYSFIRISDNSVPAGDAESAASPNVVADLPSVKITAADPTAAEPGLDTATFAITRTGPVDDPLTVRYGIRGTALHGTDYRPLSGSVVIPAGDTGATILIQPVNDSLGEPAETVVLTLESAATYIPDGDGTATVTLNDDDVPVLWIANHVALSEAGAAANLTISRAGANPSALTVNYTVGGTATAGVDYVALAGSTTLPANAASVNIPITPINDLDQENTETVVVTLAPGVGYTVGEPAGGIMFINDDDGGRPVVSVSTQNTVAYETTSAAFFFSRSGSTSAALTVSYTLGGAATAGVDYVAQTGSFVIPAGKKDATLTIAMLSDDVAEGAETLSLQIADSAAYGVGSAGGAEVLILEGGLRQTTLPSVGFARATASGAEVAGAVTVEVLLSRASTDNVTARYESGAGTATGNGVDYRCPPGTVTFAPGETSKMIQIEIIDDQVPEPAETISLRLASATGAVVSASVPSHTYTVDAHDETPPAGAAIAFAASGSTGMENAGTVGLPVARTGSTTGATTVDYRVNGGTANTSDHTLSAGTLNFAPGETLKSISVPLTNDTVAERPETLVVTLSNPTGGAVLGTPVSHTLTVTDDDATAPSVTTTPVTVAVAGRLYTYTFATGGAPAPTVTVSGLPAWLTRSGNTLSGTPPTPHLTSPISITVDNGAGPAVTQVFAILVLPAFDGWRASVFTEAQIADLAVSGPEADPDGDGLSNLLEYALGRSPLVAEGPAPLTHGLDAQNQMTLRFRRERAELVYTVQSSTDLVNWSDLLVNPGAVGGEVTVTVPSGPDTKRFLRLRVTIP